MSELASESSLAALLRPLDTIEGQLGIAVRTAMQNDVNGAGWCLPDYMNSIGLRYLTMGINRTRSILPFDKPTTFWWESPSGQARAGLPRGPLHDGQFLEDSRGRC